MRLPVWRSFVVTSPLNSANCYSRGRLPGTTFRARFSDLSPLPRTLHLLRQPQFRDEHAVEGFDAEFGGADGDGVADFREATEPARDPAADGSDAFFAQGFADEFFEFVQRQRASDVPGVLVARDEQRFLLVEFVLNLADEFFQDVFEGDH